MAPGNDAPRFVHGNTFFEFERFVGCDKFAPANAGTPVFSRAPIGVPALAIARLSHPTKRSRETKIHNVGCDKFARANAGTPVFSRAHIGVPALAIARLSHPTLFTPFRFIPTGHRVNAAPVEIILALADETMKRRPFPITDSWHELMFARVPVTVIRTAFEIVFISNGVFPISLLPDATKSVFPARTRLLKFSTAGFQPAASELFFDTSPSHGIASII